MVPKLALQGMSLPNFENGNHETPAKLLGRIGDRVRGERKRLGLTQVEFAQLCGVPLRSFKRFEAGASDSLTILLRVVQYFNRASAIEMLFPAAMLPPRGMHAALQSIRKKLDDRVVVGEAILDE
jgi:transcriptional regulator with XRE-family HTH domain